MSTITNNSSYRNIGRPEYDYPFDNRPKYVQGYETRGGKIFKCEYDMMSGRLMHEEEHYPLESGINSFSGSLTINNDLIFNALRTTIDIEEREKKKTNKKLLLCL